MNFLTAVRRIRGCEGEAAAIMALEQAINQACPPMEGELEAWKWLLALPRLDWQKPGKTFKQLEQQVIIRMIPGELHKTSGAPRVRVSVQYPGVVERVVGTGNSLYQATQMIHYELWRLGIKAPHVSI